MVLPTICDHFCLLQDYMLKWHNTVGSGNAMETVGGFLGILLENHSIPRRTEGAVSSFESGTYPLEMSSAQQFLHHAPNYEQLQLVRLIVSICDGVPESFEVFHCHSSSTQEELSLFLERMGKAPLKYILLEVNKLPFTLQEVGFLSYNCANEYIECFVNTSHSTLCSGV